MKHILFFLCTLLLIICLSSSVDAGGCKVGKMGSECTISAELGTCRDTRLGELCFGLNFPDPCTMEATAYIQEKMISKHNFLVNVTSELCFSPVIPLERCRVCVNHTQLAYLNGGLIRSLCPLLIIDCIGSSYTARLDCLSPRYPLNPNCINTAAPTPEYSPFRPVSCVVDRECHGRGECVAGKCHCKFGWTGDHCLEAKCSCGEHGRCVAPNECKCEEGWELPTCTTQKGSDSPTPPPPSSPPTQQSSAPSLSSPATTQPEESGKPNLGLIVVGSIVALAVFVGAIVVVYILWVKRVSWMRGGAYGYMNDKDLEFNDAD